MIVSKLFVEATDTWTLQVKYVQARDAGQYECQVSTEPKMSHFITLNVVETIGNQDLLRSQSAKGAYSGDNGLVRSPVTILMSLHFIPMRHLVSLSEGCSIWVFTCRIPGALEFLNSLAGSSFIAEVPIEEGTYP
ncbi:hypothetical protein NQ317_001046 [Molorchus minor]|uniref:Uncharacterized protein n=1 Tax=Molorchus minor TaxID=1323400 RepID=A0ABQ9IUZ3_9CUCU|nr:hypothetical protein NQ317_001046 [Molorchus minor]